MKPSRLILAATLLLALNFTAKANTVTLGWTAVSDVTVSGYNVYEGGASHTYTNKVAVSGRNTTTAQFTGLVEGATYYFAATSVSTNGLESTYSSEISYQVPFAAPVILTSPTSLTNNSGSTITLSVSASGSNLTYQWLKNGTNLSNGGTVSGATTATLTLTAVTGLDNGVYTVKVTNPGGSATSAPATLSVIPVAPGNFHVTGP